METATSRRRSSVGAQEEPQPPPESTEQSFKKLFASVADPQTRDHHARHVALTKNVLYQNEHGWKLVELPLVAEFLMVLRDKVIDGVEPFGGLLLDAVVLCGKPFVRVKSNEELSNPALLTEFVPTLGQLLSFEVLEIQVAAAEALRQFAIGTCLTRPGKSKNQVTDSGNNDDLRLPTRVNAQNVMEETGTVDLIVAVFHDLFPDDETTNQGGDLVESPSASEDQDAARPLTPSTKTDDSDVVHTQHEGSQQQQQQLDKQRLQRQARLIFPLVDLVYELSSHQRCAEVLVVTGALHYVVFVLGSVTSPQDELLPLCLTTLWNVLELSDEKMKTITKCTSRRELLVQFRLRNATYFLSNEFTFQVLLQTLEMLLQHGFRRQDKELRNECLMVFMLLARRSRSLDLFYSTGVTASLLSYAMSSELARKRLPQESSTTSSATAIVADPHHYATNSDEDLEFKQTLWLLVSAIATANMDNLQSIVQFRFLDVLVEYATSSTQSEQINKASSGQANKAAPRPVGSMQYSGAQLQLLQTAALAVLTNVAPFLLDHFYEIQAHVRLLDFLQLAIGTEDVLTTAWQLMLHMSPSIPHIQDELGRLGAVETALAAFDTPPSRHTYAIRRNAIITCASLCRNHEANRRRFCLGNGVHAVTKHLELDSAHVVLEENILVGIVEAVRSCVIGYADSELTFIRADGVLKLLDILEKAPKAIKNQVLATLAEITVNPAAIPSYSGWRSGQRETNNATASQVLLRLYAEEEAVEETHSALKVGSNPANSDDDERALVAATNLRSSAFRSIATCKTPLVVFPPNAADELASPTSPTDTRPASPAFARLKEALKAGQSKSTRKSLLELSDTDFHPVLNLKAKIHAVLENLSFACEQSDKLSAKELVILEIAKEYPTFRVGEMWQNVQLTLHAEGVRPTYADALYIRKQIEHAYNIAVCTKHAQKEISTRDNESGAARERAFFEGILKQKQQEEQAELFHRANRRQNSTMKLHLDAKRTRLEFMKRQDPTAFAAYEREQRKKIEDPPPVHEEELSTIAQKEKELRGRLSTITFSPTK